MDTIIVGITGASGSIYAKKTIESLKDTHNLFVVISKNGEKVFEYELKLNFREWFKNLDAHNCKLEEIDNMFAPIASGSINVDKMIIVPCTMGTLGKIHSGTSDNLLIRSADVMLKEQKKLIIVPRETPLSTIHLRNMYELSQMGVMMIPPIPSFYSFPKTIDELVNQSVGRFLKALDVDNDLYDPWCS